MGSGTSDGRETEIGDAGSPVPVDQDVRLRRWLVYKCGYVPFGREETYSFQISVGHPEVMHVLQAIRNAGQLNGRPSVRLQRDQVTTYELVAVCVPILLDEFIDVSIFHPLGNQSKPVFVQ